MIINKVNKKTIGFLRKLQKALRRSHQFTLYKAFARLHLDYDGIINDQDGVLLPNGVFNSHNPKGIRFTVKLPMGISNFRTTNAGIFFKIYYTKFVMAC